MKQYPTLFSSFTLGSLQLKNRIVMAPMTRSRAIGNMPNELMVKYYADRADAGLIITEGASPSPHGSGYSRIPGLYNEAQVAGWKAVTEAVHKKGGKIFVQLMHTGRVSHPLNMAEGTRIVAPSAIAAAGHMWTDSAAMQPLPLPQALSVSEIDVTIGEYVHSAKLAMEAGFDGIEIHGASGYLPMQFLNPSSNLRTDEYGGSVEARNRFVLELAGAIAAAIGRDKTGIRLSLANPFNDMAVHDDAEAQYVALAAGLQKLGLAYLHLVAATIPPNTLDALRAAFAGPVILNGGYTPEKAEADLAAGKASLISFGAPFIANPDLVKRWADGTELSAPDPATFYTPGEAGYTDYPTAATKRARPLLQMFSF